MKQTKLRTSMLKSSGNISFPVGTIFAVKEYARKLKFSSVFDKYKTRGRSLSSLIQALVSYKLSENLSISRASMWINRSEVLEEFDLDGFEERTLFRCLEIIGKNREEVVSGLQDELFGTYDFEHTNVNLDWTSLILWGGKCSLGEYGYSRDHRPDKKQVVVGLSEIASPVNVPIGITVKNGNIPDVSHFEDTYKQVRSRLRKGSLVVFDKGGNSKDNIDLVLVDMMKYLTAKQLNQSDDKRIKNFDKNQAELIDAENGVYGVKFVKPSSVDFFFFSERLQKQQLEAKKRKALKKLAEAQEIQDSIDNNRKLPKKYRINNELVNVTYTYQTKLKELSKKDALKLVENAAINGREGFFCIKSSENLTLQQALATYRKKDSIEKIIHSLKNEIEIKPLRVWTSDSVYGAVIIGFISQLVISLMQYDYEDLAHTSTKFIKNSLTNLTVTIEFTQNNQKRTIYSNFDHINELILTQKPPIT